MRSRETVGVKGPVAGSFFVFLEMYTLWLMCDKNKNGYQCLSMIADISSSHS